MSTVCGTSLGRITIHFKCRNSAYPRTKLNIERLFVPDDKVSWDTPWDSYNPPSFTSEGPTNAALSDPDIGSPLFHPHWNAVDGNINRVSHLKEYKIVNGLPQNPVGRTGLTGRGVLWRWGPNHAADPIVTRWKRSSNNETLKDPLSGKPLLQFVGIKRRDCGEWAIPGGMVDPGEVVTSTLKREFLEEALNTLEMTDKGRYNINQMVNTFFESGVDIYKGYVDDPRNTDNSWIETLAQNFHDETGSFVGSLPFHAGDDALQVKWLDVSQSLPLYASHSSLLKVVVDKLNAHW